MAPHPTPAAGALHTGSDGGMTAIAEFATALHRVRRAAGAIPFRVLAKETGYGTASITRLLAGKRLPRWELTRQFLLACGVEQCELGRWRQRWAETAEQVHPLSAGAPAPGTNPATDTPDAAAEQECRICGALVTNRELHARWHAQFELPHRLNATG